MTDFLAFFAPDQDAMLHLRMFAEVAGGGFLLAVALIARLKHAAIAGAAIGMAALLLAGSARNADPPVLQFAGWLILTGIGGALLTTVPHWLFHGGFVPVFGHIGNWLRRTLRPQAWAERAGVELSADDRRIGLRGALAAAAGGVVGALICQEDFIAALFDAATPRGLTSLMVLAFLAVLFLEPIYARLIAGSTGRGQDAGGADPEGMWHRLSHSRAGKFAFICVILLLFDLTQTSLEQVLRAGNPLSVWAILSGALLPALATNYWIAAIQIDTPSIWRKIAWPMTLLMVLFYLPTVIDLVFLVPQELGRASITDVSDSIVEQAAIALAISFMVLIALFTVCFVVYTVPAICGAWAMDEARDARLIRLLCLAMFVGTLPTVFGFGILDIGAGGILPWNSYLSFILGTGGWILGLSLTGVVTYAHQRRTRLLGPSAAPHPA